MFRPPQAVPVEDYEETSLLVGATGCQIASLVVLFVSRACGWSFRWPAANPGLGVCALGVADCRAEMVVFFSSSSGFPNLYLHKLRYTPKAFSTEIKAASLLLLSCTASRKQELDQLEMLSTIRVSTLASRDGQPAMTMQYHSIQLTHTRIKIRLPHRCYQCQL